MITVLFSITSSSIISPAVVEPNTSIFCSSKKSTRAFRSCVIEENTMASVGAKPSVFAAENFDFISSMFSPKIFFAVIIFILESLF